MKQYKSILDLYETQIAIKLVKDSFQTNLAKALNLKRVTAPLFVIPETGLNDNLNGYERPVSFDIKDVGKNVEIVQSLAKWKRYALKKYNFAVGTGLYTDMNAIRRDEDLDALHSCYVDQWDWEKIITKEDRTFAYLKKTVKKIYGALKKTADYINKQYPKLQTKLPKDIVFIKTKDLEKEYPELTPKERENVVAKKYGAVFLMQIGDKLKSGEPHDGRAADYDDWKLNGDIIVYNDVLDSAYEISSMGIRVDKDSLVSQLKKKGEEYKIPNAYCQGIINDELPLTIGGGIGQSRICMFFLKKAHIGEVQVSVWKDEYLQELAKKNIFLL